MGTFAHAGSLSRFADCQYQPTPSRSSYAGDHFTLGLRVYVMYTGTQSIT